MIAAIAAAAGATADPLGVVNAVSESCASADPSEIVVCAQRDPQRRYRLPRLAVDYEPAQLDAATDIAPGVGAKIRVVTVDLPGGAKSDRILLTVGTKF